MGIDSLAAQVVALAFTIAAHNCISSVVTWQRGEGLFVLDDAHVHHIAATLGARGFANLTAGIHKHNFRPRFLRRVAQSVGIPKHFRAVSSLVATIYNDLRDGRMPKPVQEFRDSLFRSGHDIKHQVRALGVRGARQWKIGDIEWLLQCRGGRLGKQ